MPTVGTLRLALVGAALALAACASTKSGDPDAATVDATDGMVSACDGVVCPGLTYCKEGVCVPFPDCPLDAGVGGGPDPDPTCAAGTVCRNGVCIPTGVDVDQDGYPAGTDCDEQNQDINPGEAESCNGVDDNCSGTVDDGDPSIMCSGDDSGRVCVAGSCQCPSGTFDLDPTVPGCECTAAPALDQGLSCATAIDVGELVDIAGGSMQNLTGNIPDGRTVWFKFRGVDSADNACDNLHVAAKLLTNPDDQFRIRVFRGDCASQIGVGTGFTDVEWYTDFRADVGGRLGGQCPCWAGTPVDNVSRCEDDSAPYYVAVERVAGMPNTCASFGVEVSNGRYDAP